jgi:hypothetical protein
MCGNISNMYKYVCLRTGEISFYMLREKKTLGGYRPL